MTMPDLSALASDGDTLELDDGRTLRLLVKPDDTDPFQEYDTYGRIASVNDGFLNDYGYHLRPHEFNGNAEKLDHYANGSTYWWQPPDDIKRTDDGFKEFRSLVIELLNYGMAYVVLEVLHGQDAYRQPIVVNMASLGGIDSLGNGYLEDVLGDLYAEVCEP